MTQGKTFRDLKDMLVFYITKILNFKIILFPSFLSSSVSLSPSFSSSSLVLLVSVFLPPSLVPLLFPFSTLGIEKRVWKTNVPSLSYVSASNLSYVPCL